jgi:hyperosmotically inducible periplasmic protein
MRRAMIPVLGGVLLAASSFAADSQKKGNNDTFLPGPANEQQMVRAIRHKLLMLPYYSIFANLAFQVNGSVVTLEGVCPPEPPWDIRSDAGNVVKRVPGVSEVINNIKLLPLSLMDWQIRRAEARAIYGFAEIGMRYGHQALPSIHIIVDNGHVTLEGVVDNQFDDTLIRMRANQVPYVFSVTDDLKVLKPGGKKKG